MTRTALLVLLLAGALSADVVVLKDGAKIAGKVADKKTHYEVTVEGGTLRTYLKEEVEKVLTSPKEILGDADASYEAAKQEYQAALAIADAAQQQARFKEAVAKVTKARESFAAALDLFPDDDAVGKKLMLVMQLMRLCRERLGSEIARRPPPAVAPAAAPAVAPPPPTPAPAPDGLATLLDAAKRADAARRAAARDLFKAQRAGDGYDIATAAMLFLARPEADWKLDAASSKALQEYLEKPWLKEPQRLTPSAHREAAAFLADRFAALKGGPGSEALALFGLAHLGGSPAGPDTEKAARALGFVVQDGWVGTAEGHVLHDLNNWISTGDFDLAVVAFVKEFRATDTPAVRFAWSWALLQLAAQRKRGFERASGALDALKTPDAILRDHVAALSKSIRLAAPCASCGGEGKLRCTTCHGRKEIVFPCKACDGKARVVKNGVEVLCTACKAKGNEKILRCDKCQNGFFDCKKCDQPAAPPALADICEAVPCALCDGRGLAFQRAFLPCRACAGLGKKLTPKADPTKTLP
jgi:hypothetical protein